ncbi:MAG: class I SAM-dependent methyltransferase [Thermoplasmata archaeon]
MQGAKSKANEVLQGYVGLFREDILISYTLAYTFYKMKATIDKMVAMEIESKGKGSMIKILDMGCNRGYDIFRMNKKFANRNISFTGLDISPLDIEHAKKFVTKNGIENCSFAVGNAESTNFEGGSFEIAICSEVLEHVPAPERILKEIHRILRSGGIAIISTPNAENRLSKLKKFAPRWLKKGWNKHLIEKTSEKEYEQLSKKGFVNLPHISEKGIKDWIQVSKGLGFKVEDVKRGSLMWGQEFFDDHPGLTGLLLFFDSILDKITYDFSSDFIIKMRK